jgi:hypothetical protein
MVGQLELPPLLPGTTLAACATILLVGMAALLVLAQSSPNFQIEYSILGASDGQLLSWSLWSGVRQAWEHDAMVLAVVVAVWSGVWPPCKLLLLALCVCPGWGRVDPGWLTRPGREAILAWSALLGKYSLLDVHVLLVTMLAFGIQPLTLCRDGAPAAATHTMSDGRVMAGASHGGVDHAIADGPHAPPQPEPLCTDIGSVRACPLSGAYGFAMLVSAGWVNSPAFSADSAAGIRLV